jgi:hypothetical protein
MHLSKLSYARCRLFEQIGWRRSSSRGSDHAIFKWEETTHSDDCRREIDESDDGQNLDCRSIFGAFLLHNI